MNFDDALKQYAPRAWFRFKFFKYKHRGRGETELRLVRHLVEPGTVAVDVGTSIGMWAAEMARHASRVIAFEANPQVAAFTARVVPRNVEVVNVALSSSNGRATLRIPRGHRDEVIAELATIEARNPHFGATDSVDVEMKRLDDCGVTSCSFVKIDVEGHEEAVLEGAPRLIAAQRPVLMMELDENLTPGAVARVGARCAAFGYRGFFLSRGAMQPIESFAAATHQDPALLVYSRKTLPADREYINNFVFAPDEKTARVRALRP